MELISPLALDMARLDSITARRTAFASFAALLNAEGNYRPTLCLFPFEAGTPENDEMHYLAAAYDASQEAKNDPRRTYRCGWGAIISEA